MQAECEKVKEGFEPEKLVDAQKRAWQAIRTIASQMQTGMLESEGQQIADKVLKEMGADRLWHKTHVRFGVNTLKTFAEISLPGVRLQKIDMFFLDIGPVWGGYEADAGATFVLGDDPLMRRCAEDAKVLHGLVRNRWSSAGESGKSLYAFAQAQARERGWEFILRGASGHRLSDFPHVLYHRGSLEMTPFVPAPMRWVLEIQLRHPTRAFGAFYEDLLL